ncbi:hypothetical protein IWX90DRAFT_439489, partial [Phyllosticta citrichinensis]
ALLAGWLNALLCSALLCSCALASATCLTDVASCQKPSPSPPRLPLARARAAPPSISSPHAPSLFLSALSAPLLPRPATVRSIRLRALHFFVAFLQPKVSLAPPSPRPRRLHHLRSPSPPTETQHQR